ncbi:hypothetical protein A2690_02130 [Candidatus Roizmanbacteria bacterium RIFCSPHIGHO2_01_FULL_39_12b]|uniref:Uncharacterized protein n=1 Tax=Candidatus Roizmanbacteria bacterium RIFCSPHIGHO2_01_FULL_39_12b TaxID=1802030 RepID=A0A1F7GE33_9BACT|nr:MAG: hypothetical protein A2690_02130 [Candidatus Roizmanbacteria bacterium RIFCSPHIGHO2_01_FULL_39_12b]OGK46326.1 MAG: hypothetical protein A3B46_00100 [Candidatus Roizmanbacteria bacterium RIFCSPLOWO2_01_FULL_39_19]
MKKYTVTLGGWYQRTTLHLSEIHGFLESGFSKLPLSKEKLESFHKNLNLKSAERHADFFEFIEAHTTDHIVIKYYEDGLYILTLENEDILSSQKTLQDYFDNLFEPAINYIFSLGAPTPKILAHIKTSHPFVVTSFVNSIKSFDFEEKTFGKSYEIIESRQAKVYKTNDYIIIVSLKNNEKIIEELIETQIFFREFKDQLEKYLNIHRVIWEEISKIKEKEKIRGREVEEYRVKLDSYQKTVDLITNRINQMGSYSLTRASIARKLDLEKTLVDLFQYRFEVLQDTLAYIQEIWSMTDKYLKTAIQTIVEIKNQSASRNIVSLQVITTVGVVAALYGHLTRLDFPHITQVGILYLIILLSLTWLINYSIMKIFKNKTYKVSINDSSRL